MRGTRISFVPLVLLLSLMMTASSFGQGRFPSSQLKLKMQPPVTYDLGANPSSLTIGDFNQDGLPDFAIVGEIPPVLQVFQNNGERDFRLIDCLAMPRNSEGFKLSSYDMNNDDRPDLLVLMPELEQIVLFMNTECFGFVEVARAPVGKGAHSMAMGDLDNDGTVDVAVANLHSNTITLLFGFAFPDPRIEMIRTGNGPCHVAIGEFDLAQRYGLDLAVTNAIDKSLAVYRNNGNGEFRLTNVMTTRSGTPDGLVLDDFDRNGELDIAVAVSGKSMFLNGAVVYYNTNGEFEQPVLFTTGGRFTMDLVSGDFDGDGSIDLFTADAGTNSLIMLTTAGGKKQFTVAASLPLATRPYEVYSVDLDRNGMLDLIALESEGKGVTVFYNGDVR